MALRDTLQATLDAELRDTAALEDIETGITGSYSAASNEFRFQYKRRGEVLFARTFTLPGDITPDECWEEVKALRAEILTRRTARRDGER